MKKRTKAIAIISVCACAALIAAAGIFAIIGDPVVAVNNAKLSKSVKSIEADTVRLNEVVPFEWDILYTFEPYTSKERIEEIIGFKSDAVKANDVNEGMVHLLFVRNGKVAASVLGYSESLGYGIDFASKVTYAENALFGATKKDGVTLLTHIK